MTQTTARTRGRPRKCDDAQILAAALRAFAGQGFEAMSVRALNAELGLSSATVNERFRSKENLFHAAVAFGFDGLLGEVREAMGHVPPDECPLDRTRRRIHAFLVASAHRPELVRLMNIEGLQHSPRLDYIFTTWVEPGLKEFFGEVRELMADGVLQPRPMREVLFMIAHGAAAPFTLTALSDHFDPIDGPLDVGTYAASTVEFLIAGFVGTAAPPAPRRAKRSTRTSTND